MKKTLLFLSLALFIAAGVVTATKVKTANAATSEMVSTGDDNTSIATASLDGDDKTKKDDKAKATKDGKTDCSKSCGSKTKGGEAKCAEAKCSETKCAGTKCAETKCAELGKECCSKDKSKSCDKDKK